jgi:hypothetical protein
MEIVDSENKYVRGINITADTANVAVAFQVLYDGGQTGPLTTATAFNGKKTVSFAFDPPFVAHDLQIVPQSSARIFLTESKWILDPWAEYTTVYSPWMNLGRQEPKYIRSLTLPLDTKGLSASLTVVSSDGDSVSFSATTAAGVKTPVGFAFIPPIVVHEVQIRMNSSAAMWPEESQWDFDPYPEIIPEYTPIMEVGGAGAKYFRGLTLTADTANIPVSFQILYDGGQIGPVFTDAFNGKQTKAFAFTPFVFHDIQIVPQANARIWIAESQWHFDSYPELTAEYTPIMEIGGPDNKFVQGCKLIADTANLPVVFQVLFDGGQTGPSFTGTFNGKQTIAFSWTPFLAHDIQLVPQSNARIWWGGIGDGVSEWCFQPFPEASTLWQTELTALGGFGWQHLRLINLEYISTASATLSFVVDTGNGSIVPASITIPSSGGTQTKLKITPTYNKWKLISFGITSSAPITVFQEGLETWTRSWGSAGEYNKQKPFAGPSAPGAIV